MESSYFKVDCCVDSEVMEGEQGVDGGPVDAAFKCLKKTISEKYPGIAELELIDFNVSIASRHGEESAVRTEIFFRDEVGNGDDRFSTVGVDNNILQSSIEALEKGINYYLIKNCKKNNVGSKVDLKILKNR